MVNNYILKRNARDQLGNNIFGRTWLMMLAVYIVYSAIVSAAAYVAVGLGAIVVGGPLLYGMCRISVKLVKGKSDIDVGELFCGFTEKFFESLLLGLMSGLFTYLWSLLFVVPGIIKSYSYSMAPYIMQDSIDKDWEECIDESKQLMDGHKWQAFCLDMSFLGWYLLGALAFGIGTFFVVPYHQTARANFYLALIATHKRTNSNDFGGDFTVQE
jgi:uncharacterized membrane protein